VTQVFMRVSGSGPSGIIEGNLPGIYVDADNKMILAFYDDGTMNSINNSGSSGLIQYGSYAVNGSTLSADFVFSNDPDGPMTGEMADIEWSRSGDVVTLTMPEDDPEDFNACPNGFDGGGPENLWLNANNGTFSLLLYNGEFAGTGE
jgi:hypothetical protein